METITIIPAYNEERTIREVIIRCKEVNTFPVVIDDGSIDNTYEIARKLTTVLSNIENKGKGEALKVAFKYVKDLEVKYIVIIDGDLQYNPYEIPKLIGALENYDYVIGSRNWSKVPLRHRLGNYVWIKTFNFLFKTNLKDTNCGFVAMKKELVTKLKVSSGYVVDNDILIQVLMLGYKVKNVPVSVRYNHCRDIFSGLRMGLGILFFIIIKRFKNDN